MVITLGSELEAALNELARRQGIAPEVLAVDALRERFLPPVALQPRDEWERGLLEAARHCGVSLPDPALSSEGLYDEWPT
jgi:predicted transcriptional regulator